MTEEKLTFDELFAKAAAASDERIKRNRQLTELGKEEESEKFHLQLRGQKLKIAWLMEEAESNLKEMMLGNKVFAEYMSTILTERGESFSDRWDACGLLIPPILKKSERTAMQKNPGLAIQRIMSPEHQREMTTSIRLLKFWQEELPPKKEEHTCYGERRRGGLYDHDDAPSQTIAAIAFRVTDECSKTPGKNDLLNPRIVAIRDQKREDISFGPNGLELINDLLDLSIPELALRFLFNRFN